MKSKAPPTSTVALQLQPLLLSSKLVVTGIWTAGLALLTVVLALTAVDYWSARASMLQDSAVEAAIVADNVLGRRGVPRHRNRHRDAVGPALIVHGAQCRCV